MFSYTDKFGGIMRYAFSSEGDVANEIGELKAFGLSIHFKLSINTS